MASQDRPFHESDLVAAASGSDGGPVAVELGEQIARLRSSRGLSQQQLADRIGISKGQLQVIERGWSDRAKRTPANPRLSTLIGLCRELGARIDLAYPAGLAIVLDEDGQR